MSRETELEELVRLLWRTKAECGAALWLQNTRSGAWYEWACCNQEAGHPRAHGDWSERDSDYSARWTDDALTQKSLYLRDYAGEFRFEPSPWTPLLLGALNPLVGEGNTD